MKPGKSEALEEARKLLEHLASFLDRHDLIVPELVVKSPGVEARLSLKRLAIELPGPEGK